jgi:hypothetical protein
MKARTVLTRKLKEIFRRFRSQPVDRVIALINPRLRGWVNYFPRGTLKSLFRLREGLDREEGSAPSDARAQAPGLWLEAVE